VLDNDISGYLSTVDFQDTDYEVLLHPELDGGEENLPGATSLRYDDAFKAFHNRTTTALY
jgi:hypothetical protein